MEPIDPSKCNHPSFYYNERPILDSNGKVIDTRLFLCCAVCNQAIYESSPKTSKKSKVAQPVQPATDPKTQEIIQKLTDDYQKFKETLSKEVDEKLRQIRNQVKPPATP